MEFGIQYRELLSASPSLVIGNSAHTRPHLTIGL